MTPNQVADVGLMLVSSNDFFPFANSSMICRTILDDLRVASSYLYGDNVHKVSASSLESPF